MEDYEGLKEMRYARLWKTVYEKKYTHAHLHTCIHKNSRTRVCGWRSTTSAVVVGQYNLAPTIGIADKSISSQHEWRAQVSNKALTYTRHQ